MPGLALSRQGAQELAALQPPIDPATFPRFQPGNSVCLPSSGRRLGYCEHVDTSIPTDQLRTVILLPGIPGTRLFTHPAVQQRGCVPSWRLIVLERPGIGLSDPAPEPYGYTDFVKDFREFCGLLGLPRVAVIGFSAGTPFATAVACVPPAAVPPPPLSSPAADPAAAASTATSSAVTAAAAGPEPESKPQPPPPPRIGHQSTDAPRPLEQKQELVVAGPAESDEATCQEVAAAAAAAAAAARQEGCRAGQADGGDSRETHGSAAAGGAAAPNVINGAAAAAERGEAECSGGGGGDAAAVAAAAALVVDGVALVSAIGPPDTPNKRQGMALLFQFAYWACAHASWLVGWVVRSEAAAFRRRPLHALRQGFAPYSGKADVAALKRSEVERMFLESAMEIYGRGQEDVVLRENLLFAGRPCWDFDLAACRTPVAIWQGGQDRGCTAAMATHLAQQLGPTARAKVVPMLGHMLYFDLWEEVVDWVNGLPRV